jgi:hypothetical protein
MLTAERLRNLLDYDHSTGAFRWRQRRKGVRANGTAGCVNKLRRVMVIFIDGRLYLAHRLAWLHVYGAWPVHQIDHIDGDSMNNCIENLRDVSVSVNQQNRKRAARHSRSGVIGVRARNGRWVAEIRVNGVAHCLGRFDSSAAAHVAYIEAKRRLHAGCTL